VHQQEGRPPFEDDRGGVEQGKDALKEIERQWRFGGAYIGDAVPRREAFNVMLSMPRGTDPLAVQRAAREFARIELAGHRYVMVLHDHQANPHVHLSVKAESRHGIRLLARPTCTAGARRLPSSFARPGSTPRRVGKRQEGSIGIRKPCGGSRRKGKADSSFRAQEPRLASRREEVAPKRHEAWRQISITLASSDSASDRLLAERIVGFVKDAAPTRSGADEQRRRHESNRMPAKAPSIERRNRGPEIQR